MKKISINNEGFTLVEMIVVLAVMVILGGVFYQFFTATMRYNDSIDNMNDCQSTVSNTIYRLRAEMADAKDAVSYTVDKDTFNPDVEITNDGFTYIIPNKDGGFTMYWYDETGIRQTSPIGTVDPAKRYTIRGSFLTTMSGNTQIVIAAHNIDEADETKNIYTLTSNITLRKSSVEGVFGNAIKFKKE